MVISYQSFGQGITTILCVIAQKIGFLVSASGILYFPPTDRNVPWVLGVLTDFCVLPTVIMRIVIPLFPPYVFKSRRLVRHMNIFAFASDPFVQVSNRHVSCDGLGPATFRSVFRRPISFSDAPKYIESTQDTWPEEV